MPWLRFPPPAWLPLAPLLLTSLLVAPGAAAQRPAAVSAAPLPDVDTAETLGAPMQLTVRELVVPHAEFGLFALPGEAVAIDAAPDGPFSIAAEGGRIEQRRPYVAQRRDQAWTWVAPAAPGLYTLTVTRQHDGRQIRLNAFVMVPSSAVENGRLNGYRIGEYPAEPLRGNPIYLPPPGLIELHERHSQVRVAPHFRIGEFVSKQSDGYPKYLVLSERLLLALETVISELRGAGIDAASLHVMSGYRTPYYNRAIGNVRYSLHQWGLAADVFIDERPRDGVMDDLDGDGRITRADAQRLYDHIDALHARPLYRAYTGGTGLYAPAFPRRGPFVHVDVRGWRARW